MNPEPMHAFIDLFVIGEGEEIINEIIDIFKSVKKYPTAIKRSPPWLTCRVSMRLPISTFHTTMTTP